MTERLHTPPWQDNPEGNPRRVGVEIEMNGLALDQIAKLVADCLGLEVESAGRYERVLKGDEAGDWAVELDFNLLKEMGRETRKQGRWEDELADTAEQTLAWLAEEVVPMELVSPPLPLSRLDEIETLITRLREAGAKGTSDGLINAFGMQFNPEIPTTDSQTLVAILKAFHCLYPWLWRRANINLTRQITSYVNPFPMEYVRLVIASDYWPDLSTLIDDYLAHNPTRNRALDMLPLFVQMDEERVHRVTDDPLIKPRPTFHYRLPDSEIDLPGWGLHTAWNDWVEVERLAAEGERLQACCEAYRDYLDQPLKRLFEDWARIVEREWLAR